MKTLHLIWNNIICENVKRMINFSFLLLQFIKEKTPILFLQEKYFHQESFNKNAVGWQHFCVMCQLHVFCKLRCLQCGEDVKPQLVK